MQKHWRRLLLVVVVLLVLPAASCIILGLLPVGGAPILPPEAIIVGAQGQADGAKIAEVLPTIITPEKNPITAEKRHLGQLLFFDPILSAKHDMACATCHHPD